MAERVNVLLVVLEEGIAAESIHGICDAVRQMRGVLTCAPGPHDSLYNEQAIEMRTDVKWRNRILQMLDDAGQEDRR